MFSWRVHFDLYFYFYILFFWSSIRKEMERALYWESILRFCLWCHLDLNLEWILSWMSAFLYKRDFVRLSRSWVFLNALYKLVASIHMPKKKKRTNIQALPMVSFNHYRNSVSWVRIVNLPKVTKLMWYLNRLYCLNSISGSQTS